MALFLNAMTTQDTIRWNVLGENWSMDVQEERAVVLQVYRKSRCPHFFRSQAVEKFMTHVILFYDPIAIHSVITVRRVPAIPIALSIYPPCTMLQHHHTTTTPS